MDNRDNQDNLPHGHANVLYQPFLFSTNVVDDLENIKLNKTKGNISHSRNIDLKKGRWAYTHFFVEHNRVLYLTNRQAECLQLTKNHTYKEVARMLGISVRTVEYYMFLLRKKLGYRGKNELLKLVAQIRVINA